MAHTDGMRRIPALAVLAAGLLATGLTAAAPAQAATVTRVTSFTAPSEPVDLETSPGVVMRAHLVDPVGIIPGDTIDRIEDATYVLTNVAGAALGGGYAGMGHLISGTPQDGDWEFDPFGGARAYGAWEANQIHVVRLDGTSAYISLRGLGFPTTIRTIGRFGAFIDRQSPATGANTTIVYGSSVTMSGRLYWIDELVKRHPIPATQVRVKQEDQVGPVIGPPPRLVATTTTRADGTFTATFKPERSASRIYLESTKGTLADGVRYMDSLSWTLRVDVKFRLGIRSRPASFKAGTIGYVEGSIAPARAGANAYLQRYKSGKWTIVSSAPIRSSGRFTLAAQPPAKGSFRYRVYKASDSELVYNVTPEFSIKGT
jgi:hypothetical protein